ncbi:hypothetical protein D3C74_397090 [compost metagenome]
MIDVSIKIKGFDKIQKDLKDLSKKANDLQGQRDISFEELFNESFMEKYTSFTNFNDFLVAGNFVVNSKEDFEAIPDDVFDTYIRDSTQFESWNEMQEEAVGDYVARQLGL